ncbi:MAG: Rrf2 family transcriptional regulator [Planctomycetes bacterium]|nr:Rrf2 family transcriptional regulator [Planctomycetota bacterium]
MIYGYYREHGRTMPWRLTHSPYHILVSEIMLQQTQVQRVLEKYEPFLDAFPDFAALARAPLSEVLAQWQGLGYNRRAIALSRVSRMVLDDFHGVLPSSVDTLMTFPGIGHATASAIAAFAFLAPAVFIETNIRRVYIHCFFRNKDNVRDDEILPLVEMTLDVSNPREWYYGVMDYGVMLKKSLENPNRRCVHYQKQSPFEGSNQQIRGMILKALTCQPHVTGREIARQLQVDTAVLKKNLLQLQKEGFIKKIRGKIAIA